ncbi:MAG TPA: tetratricopeptide repeat protein [Candidatus Acidoferrum sp.]|nr:tetratricopeptide repeat protein [Candidatus Acidoferrum sp.]
MQSRFFALLGAALLAPILASAQAWVHIGPTGSPGGTSSPGGLYPEARSTISVRELNVPGKARKSFDKGSRLLDSGDAAASVPEFQRAIADYRFFSEAYYQLGRAQLSLGLSQDAAQTFTKAIEVSAGRFALPYFALSMALCQQNNFAEGDTVAKTGLSLEPTSLLGQFALSWAEVGLGRTALAEKTLSEVLRRKTDFREARLLLVELHFRAGDLRAMLDDVEGYLKLDATSPVSARLRALRENTLQSLAESGSTPQLVDKDKP